MKKNMRYFLSLAISVSLLTPGAAWAVDDGSDLGPNSAHNANPPNTQGVCAKCHVPHGGKGDKIWASDPAARVDFLGVQQLCNTCHYTGNPVGATFYTVFQINVRMNHVMHDWADISGPTVPAYDSVTFPLDPGDLYLNMPWTGVDPDGVVGDDGFYCGSCHNPHRQPFLDGAASVDGNGDYLRGGPMTLAQFGQTDRRLGACSQCHSNVFPGGVSVGHYSLNCSTCHDPHEGLNMPTGDPVVDDFAEKILIVSAGIPFIANPNVPGFTPGSPEAFIASLCYDCHEDALNIPGSLPTGSTKIVNASSEHHPMGTNAPNPADQGDHAPGWTAMGGGELSCLGCHDVHNGIQDYYLDQSIGTWAVQDDPSFCLACHTQHSLAGLGTLGFDHSRISTWVDGQGVPDTGARGGCMFCHYIHDGNNAPGVNSPGVDPSEDALMRQDAFNLRWADTDGDSDERDYEDMCMACHADSTITGLAGAGSSFDDLLVPGVADWFSHRTNTTPSAVGDNPVIVLASAAGLPMYGDASVALQSYTGSSAGDNLSGQMFCGTCHNVHVQNLLDGDGNFFRVVNNNAAVRSGLCLACHGSAPMTAGGSSGVGASVSHPIGGSAILPSPVTANPINPQYGNGGDGYMGGRTSGNVPNGGADTVGQMQCETCHNFHVSVTNHEGSSSGHSVIPSQNPEGRLMILNNSSSGLCGTCHVNY